MEIIIEWTELSERQLKDIYDYYLNRSIIKSRQENNRCNYR